MTQKIYDIVNDRAIKNALQWIAEEAGFRYEDLVKAALYEYISRNEKRKDINLYNHAYLTGKTEEEIKKESGLPTDHDEDVELFDTLTQEYQDIVLSDDYYDSVYIPENKDVHFIEEFIRDYQITKEAL